MNLDVWGNVWENADINPHKSHINEAIIGVNVIWQRRWDSNPRDPFRPIPLAGGRLRPLGHVSADPSNGELRWGQAGFTQVLQHF